MLFPAQRFTAGLLSLFLLLSAPAAVLAQTKPKRTDVGIEQPRTILFVGHSYFSYNNGLYAQVLGLARAADPANRDQYRYTSVTINGSSLEWHDLKSYLRPNGLAKYSLTPDNEVVFNKTDKIFEVVVMSDCSQCTIHPQLKGNFQDAVKKQATIVARHSMKPVLFMDWAYKDKPEMTAQIAEQYTIAGNANDALVIPAGLAFAKAMARKPDVELYGPEKRYPSVLGTYLAAATTYAAIYRKSPVGSAYTAGLDPNVAKFLQTVAWDTVQEYYGK
jgi:hypothetical protein